MLPPVAVMVPPPRSVAMAAEFDPSVCMSTLVRVILPPWVAITPWPPPAVALMVMFVSVTDEPEPVAKAPLAPSPVVEMVPPVTLTAPLAVASRPAFRP